MACCNSSHADCYASCQWQWPISSLNWVPQPIKLLDATACPSLLIFGSRALVSNNIESILLILKYFNLAFIPFFWLYSPPCGLHFWGLIVVWCCSLMNLACSCLYCVDTSYMCKWRASWRIPSLISSSKSLSISFLSSSLIFCSSSDIKFLFKAP